MKFRGGRQAAVEEAKKEPSPRSMIASAMQVDTSSLMSWRSYPLGRDQAWQMELWRLYDLVGEFRFAANWVGAMLSRVRIYVADVDKYGKIGAQTEEDDVQGLADSMLGGPTAQAELLRLMGINFTVAGEFYIVGRSGRGAKADQWFVVTPSELTRWAGGVMYNYEGGPIQLLDDVDMLIRVWTPHPRWVWRADAPARAALQIIVEIERLTRYVFSQIDSRLFGAGLLCLPAGFEMMDETGNNIGLEGLFAKLAEAGVAALKGEGSAMGILPVMAEFPGDVVDKIRYLTFDSPLSEQAPKLRDEAIKRFAFSMDFPPEILVGLGASNHWSAWYIDENAIKVHVEPLMGRVCAALTEAYLAPALKKNGKDPAKYSYWYDTSGLTPRPTRTTDAINLYKERLLSGEAVLEAAYFRSDQAMSDQESAELFIRDVILRDPTQFAIASVRKAAGVTDDILPAGTYTPPPPPPVPQSGAIPGRMGVVPPRTSEPPGQAPAPSPGPASLTASAKEVMSVNLALITAANLLAQRALELAGGRLLTRNDRGRWPDVPKYELHTKIRVRDAMHASSLLAGAWEHVPQLMKIIGGSVTPAQLQDALGRYCVNLMVMERPHDPDDLVDTLRREGLIDD